MARKAPNGYIIIPAPVAYDKNNKDPDETDAGQLRIAADRLSRNHDIGGGPMRPAIETLLRDVADALERQGS